MVRPCLHSNNQCSAKKLNFKYKFSRLVGTLTNNSSEILKDDCRNSARSFLSCTTSPARSVPEESKVSESSPPSWWTSPVADHPWATLLGGTELQLSHQTPTRPRSRPQRRLQQPHSKMQYPRLRLAAALGLVQLL